MSQAATTDAGYVIRCAGIHGAYGPPPPTGLWLYSLLPDPPGALLTEWTPDRYLACRFPTEADAAECAETLACLYRTRIDPLPAPHPPVIDGRYSQLLRGRQLTETERAEAQDAVDRLWLDGHLR